MCQSNLFYLFFVQTFIKTLKQVESFFFKRLFLHFTTLIVRPHLTDSTRCFGAAENVEDARVDSHFAVDILDHFCRFVIS